MSACPSSPISVIAARPGWRPWEPEAVPVDLLAALAGVPDPRARRGVRHGLVAVLAIGVCGVLAGARTFTAIAEWAQDLTGAVRTRLGLGRRPAPRESTTRRTPARRRRRSPRPGRLGLAGGAIRATVRDTGAGIGRETGPGGPGDRHRREERSGSPRIPRAGQASARGLRPGQRGRAGPDRGRRQDQRDQRLRAAAEPHRHHRRDHHRRRCTPSTAMPTTSSAAARTTCSPSRATSPAGTASSRPCPGTRSPRCSSPGTKAIAASSPAPSSSPP